MTKFTAFVSLLLLLSVLAADSDSIFPMISVVVCSIYLGCIAVKCGLLYNPKNDR